MPRNTLNDLNNLVFEQLEKVLDDSLSLEGLKIELQRSSAVSNLAGKVIENAQLALNAEKLRLEFGNTDVQIPNMIGNKNG